MATKNTGRHIESDDHKLRAQTVRENRNGQHGKHTKKKTFEVVCHVYRVEDNRLLIQFLGWWMDEEKKTTEELERYKNRRHLDHENELGRNCADGCRLDVVVEL